MSNIRRAEPIDGSDLTELFAELDYPASAVQLTARLSRLVLDDTYEAWVAQGADSLVGFAAGHIVHPIEDDAPAVQLIALVVSTRARGSHLGADLCATFEAWAVEQGASRAVVNSRAGRADAHRFYARCGYERSGIRFGKVLTGL